MTLTVFVSGNPRAKNKEVFEYLKTIKSDHAAAKLTRTLRNNFELQGDKGLHVCLVHNALGVTLKLVLELVKPIIYHVLFALDYLHSQAKVVHEVQCLSAH